MMKKKMIAYVLLVAVTCLMVNFVAVSPVHASESDVSSVSLSGRSEVVYSSESAHEKTQVARMGKMLMYFHDTQNYTTSAILYPSGDLEIAEYNKSTKKAIQSVSKSLPDLGFDKKSRSADSPISLFTAMEKKMSKGEFATKEVEYIMKSPGFGPVARTSDNRKIYDAMDRNFGGEYYSRYRDRLTARGYTAKLYETQVYDCRDNIAKWVFYAKTSISILSAVMSIPTWTITHIFKVTYEVINGVRTIVNEYEAEASKYKAYVHNNKFVKVNGYTRYYAGKTRYGEVNVGNLSASYKTVASERADRNFYNHNFLMRKAIDNHINFIS